jgi:hypothetical protein
MNGLFQVHRLMLSDVPRTSTYQKVIANNAEYFKGKSVLGRHFKMLKLLFQQRL